MNKKTIFYVVGTLALFYLLKKKRMLGNIEEKAIKLTAEEVDNLDFKIDYRDFADIYKEHKQGS